MARRRSRRTVFEARSPISGRVRVVEIGGERRLIVKGDTLSVFPLSGDWSAVRREYWWRALDGLRLPPRPTALFVGLGGGTQIHLLRQMAPPRAVTVIERDPVIIRAARTWFGLNGLGGIEIVRGDAEAVVARLIAARRRFGVVVEDATYAETAERSLPLLRTLVRLVSARGVLVINRHFRRDARLIAAEMGRYFRDVSQRRVRRQAENVVVRCVGRKLSPWPRYARPARPRSGSVPRPGSSSPGASPRARAAVSPGRWR